MLAGCAYLLLTVFLAPPPTTEAARADFLRRARVSSGKKLSEGVTESRRVTLKLGAVRHDAHVQTVEDPAENDSYRYNLAAFAVGGSLGLNSIPVTVQREFQGRPASFTWWIDDALMSEKTRLDKGIKPPDTKAWNQQVYVMKVFDLLIHNVDRNMGNVIIDKRWKLWMIDHSRAFQPAHALHDPEDVLGCDRTLFARLRQLDAASLQPKLATWLTAGQLSAILIRRDLIVKALEARIAEKGEAQVLFDYLPAR
ncbi:MAG TPA: hypothetical protein VGK29_01660 [Paludibaculum sp.]|jgi:hypothetical protein